MNVVKFKGAKVLDIDKKGCKTKGIKKPPF